MTSIKYLISSCLIYCSSFASLGTTILFSSSTLFVITLLTIIEEYKTSNFVLPEFSPTTSVSLFNFEI